MSTGRLEENLIEFQCRDHGSFLATGSQWSPLIRAVLKDRRGREQ